MAIYSHFNSFTVERYEVGLIWPDLSGLVHSRKNIFVNQAICCGDIYDGWILLPNINFFGSEIKVIWHQREKKRARKGETTALNLAAISSSGFIWSDQRSDLWQRIIHSWSHQLASKSSLYFFYLLYGLALHFDVGYLSRALSLKWTQKFLAYF